MRLSRYAFGIGLVSGLQLGGSRGHEVFALRHALRTLPTHSNSLRWWAAASAPGSSEKHLLGPL